MTRSPQLKLAVWWLAAQAALAVVLLFVWDVSVESRFIGIVVAAFIAWILYGVWNFRRWARYPLLVLLILALLLTVTNLPSFSVFNSLADFVPFVLSLLFAAANAIAYDELKKATGINPPII